MANGNPIAHYRPPAHWPAPVFWHRNDLIGFAGIIAGDWIILHADIKALSGRLGNR
jgi:hypothetical protein